MNLMNLIKQGATLPLRPPYPVIIIIDLGDPDSLYFKIDGENYREIITDLIGMRLIINYRGKWEMIHNEIVQHFPYVEEKLYDEYDLIPMDKLDKNALVQIPTIYYAQGDNIEPYRKYHIVPKLHNMGYRSIHYTVCSNAEWLLFSSCLYT